MNKPIKAAEPDPRDYLFGTGSSNPHANFGWHTDLLPDVLDKKAWLISVDPSEAKKSSVAHAFCNAMEVFLNEIGEQSQLDRDCVLEHLEQPEITLGEFVSLMRTKGVHGFVDKRLPIVTRYERLRRPQLIEELRVALFCNLIPVIGLRVPLDLGINESTYCTAVVGVNHEKQYIVCASNFGPEFGENGFFYLPYEYVLENVFDAFVIREVNGLRAMIPEELYNREVKLTEAVPAKARKSIWRKIASLWSKDG